MYPGSNNYMNQMYQCEKQAETLYPKIYIIIFPYVMRKCEEIDHSDDDMMYPFPAEEKVNEMVEDIYKEYKKDAENYKKKDKKDYDNYYRRYDYDYYDYYDYDYDDRGIRDVAKILLLRQLLRRRRRPYWWRRRRFRRPPYWYY